MKKNYTMFFFLFFSVLLFSQQKMKITGYITDINNAPLIGANVMLPSINIGAVSNLDGKYLIEVPESFLSNQRTKRLCEKQNFVQFNAVL